MTKTIQRWALGVFAFAVVVFAGLVLSGCVAPVMAAGVSGVPANIRAQTVTASGAVNAGSVTASGEVSAGSVAVSGAVTSTKACAAGYTRRGVDYCSKDVPSGGGVGTTCTVVSVPPQAKQVELSVNVDVLTVNAIGARSALVQLSQDAACSTAYRSWSASAYEFAALAEGASIGGYRADSTITLSGVGQSFSMIASGQTGPTYQLVGYYD